MVLKGEMEIDVEHGVIEFRTPDQIWLRITGLPVPVETEGLIDINASTPGIVSYDFKVQE